jgi:tetratricopeptide (TPR) repeat protein
MTHYLQKQDWTNIGKYYVLYFETAAARSEYPINSTSYLLSKHVEDPNVLEAAIKTVKSDIESFSENDPTEIDTYANLLYKAGRAQEAIDWEQNAVRLSRGSDQEIRGHLLAMTAGQPILMRSVVLHRHI